MIPRTLVGLLSLSVGALDLSGVTAVAVEDPSAKHHKLHHHHRHSGHHHRHHDHHAESASTEDATTVAPASASPEVSQATIMARLQALEHSLDSASKVAPTTPAPVPVVEAKLEVNAPLPNDFEEKFAASLAAATGSSADQVKVVGAVPLKGKEGQLDEVAFKAGADIVKSVLAQAADPESKLANGPMHSFLIAKDSEDEPTESKDEEKEEKEERAPPVPHGPGSAPETDMAMPFGDLEPFGREDTAKDLTEASIRESDAMVDQLERAEIAEEKRAIFRALTRLRGAAITSFDGVARSQTGNLDEYSRKYKWRKAHPLNHLADEESDVTRWAFPESSD
mmetsp:Transcript_7764/g.11218  ORF Transcript_7764/g.11218 Transcript_7764/m.11218 type:complete len:338 (+) Transcript_7764:142-1155(+)